MTDEEFAEIREEFTNAGVAILELKKQLAAAEEHLFVLSDEWGEAFDDDEQMSMAQEGWRRIGIDEETIASMTEQILEYNEQLKAYAAEQKAAFIEAESAPSDPLSDFTVIGETG